MGNNSSINRALNILKSKLAPKQLDSPLVKLNNDLIQRKIILYNRVTALVPVMPPNRGRAAKTAAVNSMASKSKAEKNETDSEIDEDVEMAVDVKKQVGRKKKEVKENGDDKAKPGRGRKKAEPLEEEAQEEAPKVPGKGKKKGKESSEEPEVRKSGRAKKKEEQVEEEPPKKIAKGKKKPEVENGEEVEEKAKGRKKAEEKPAKRGKKARMEEEEDEENGVEEEEKLPAKRGRRAAKEAQEEEEVEAEKPAVKRGRKPKEAKGSEESKEKPKGRGKKGEEEEEEPKKKGKDEKKLMNEVNSNLEEIDFNCEKVNAKGDRYNIKICSWNVSGMRAVMEKQGIKYIVKEDADIVLLQETKCDVPKIPKEWDLPGYKRYFVDSAKSGYAGVGLYSKKEPIGVKYGLEEAFDDEGRLITAEFEGFYVVNVYVPNAGKGLSNLAKRLEWNAAFKKYLKELDEKKPVILCGDMNVAHNEIDIANPKSNVKNPGFSKEEREGMSDFLAAGFVDTFRQLYPEKSGAYTFWSYMKESRSKNIGWRLDYFIVSERVKENVCDNVIRNSVYGSDHCPIVLYANL